MISFNRTRLEEKKVIQLESATVQLHHLNIYLSSFQLCGYLFSHIAT